MDAALATGEDRLEGVRLLVESAAGIASRDGDLKAIRHLRFSRPGIDRGRWSEISAMGWLGIRLPEAAGGAGLGMAEYAALAGEVGAALLPEPLIEAQLALDFMGKDAPAEALSGDKLILPAWLDAPDGLTIAGDITEAEGRISGRQRFVPMAAAANAFLVVSTEACWLVDAKAAGMSLEIENTIDGGHTATLILDGVEAERLSAPDAKALEAAALATASALLGIMGRAFAITLDYLKTRVQFGQPIGHFQALQHRAVDMEIEIGLTRAVLRDAVEAFDSGDDCRRIVSRAKARAADAAMLVTRQAVQLHGAIGYTEEADIGLFLRRAMVLAPRYGSAGFHRQRYGGLTEGRP
ncbi:alkylation response protein AidB-like acyl-CoA dehydrogenase [Rhizobium petrolearium]|jgi:alkylation response protein AidB-like acyl-CoA dehydrogenase|uniref:Acyl-CoA dehydrogenase family protein n=2 Tax=Neorhizobium TaxID=1525371 RepID=A0ABV0MD66_9HYPH|nr:acyl-CoA dehydrogenase family protein [Neorhizobium petrolearium]MBP1847247.1 alkylation response protein AidB-like acyl-CoA dehydrogenase [Neorhizobium petrolearium]MCC2614294.1 acyl-CoA dehydrogenase family protein [Neorhizobium petrolearium]WGI72398.1 acyl-CoA dehydrogenase family protein [Neorhizobium petrolearium]